MKPLTSKQEKFAQEWYATGNKSEAYRRAYDAENMGEATINVKASQLSKCENVSSRFNEIKKESQNSNRITVDSELIIEAVGKLGSLKEVKYLAEKAIVDAINNIDIELDYLVTRKRNPSNENRYLVLSRVGFKCQACGAKPSPDNDVELNIDHIIPFSLGGGNNASNLQVLCFDCNMAKSNMFTHNHNSELQQ